MVVLVVLTVQHLREAKRVASKREAVMARLRLGEGLTFELRPEICLRGFVGSYRPACLTFRMVRSEFLQKVLGKLAGLLFLALCTWGGGAWFRYVIQPAVGPDHAGAVGHFVGLAVASAMFFGSGMATLVIAFQIWQFCSVGEQELLADCGGGNLRLGNRVLCPLDDLQSLELTRIYTSTWSAYGARLRLKDGRALPAGGPLDLGQQEAEAECLARRVAVFLKLEFAYKEEEADSNGA